MRTIFLSLLIFISSSCCNVNEKFVDAVEKNWYTIRPEYIEYVKHDETLSEMEKDVKMITVEMFDSLIIKIKNN